MDDAMTTADLAARWGISPRAARAWVLGWAAAPGDGTPPVEHKAGRLFVRRQDVEAWEDLRRRLRMSLPGRKARRAGETRT